MNPAAYGRNGDTVMGHLSKGDVVIPRDIIHSHPEFLTKFKKAMEGEGADYRGHIVGSGFENKNPVTHAPEFFFTGLFRGIRKVIQDPLPTLGAAATGFALGGPIGAGLGVSSGLAGAAAGGALGTLGAAQTAATPTGYDSPQRTQERMITNALTPVGGSSTPAAPAAAPFTPTRPSAMGLPGSLSYLSSMDPTQQRSALATQGAFGGGLGDDQQSYYYNLLRRNLVSDTGQVGDANSLLPVERTYLSQSGVPVGDAGSILKSIQGAS